VTVVDRPRAFGTVALTPTAYLNTTFEHARGFRCSEADDSHVIERLWYGWTAPEDADEYERLLREEIFPGFAEEGIEGFRGFRVLRREREADDEVEFVTVMRFGSLDAVREFAGDDYRQAHVPPAAREVLSRFDDRARHYEVREREEY